MARLLLISEKTYNPGVNAVGDIVGVFPDAHVFTDREEASFTIVDIPNITNKEFVAALKSPNIQTIIDDAGVEHTMWRNSDTDPWRKLEKPVKYTWTTAGISVEDQAIFMSSEVDGDVKIAMLEQFGNNISYQPENRTTTITVSITEQTV